MLMQSINMMSGVLPVSQPGGGPAVNESQLAELALLYQRLRGADHVADAAFLARNSIDNGLLS